MIYFFISGVFEANSGCNHHIKSGKILIDRKTSQKLRSLFKTLAGSPESNSVEFDEEKGSQTSHLYLYIFIEKYDFSKMRYYVYVLLSIKDKRFYIGFTSDLKNRLSEHAKGNVRSTKDRRPLKLIHYEYFIDKADAKAREVFLKSGFGRNQLKEALKRTLVKLGYNNL